MEKHLKKRKLQEHAHIERTSAVVRVASSQLKKPIFSFHSIDKRHGISLCEKNEKCALIDKLTQLSELTWMQIMNANRHAAGCEKIEKLNVPIPSFIQKDVNFLAFRFDGKKPMVGYRQNEIFHILWIDREFKVYNHG